MALNSYYISTICKWQKSPLPLSMLDMLSLPLSTVLSFHAMVRDR